MNKHGVLLDMQLDKIVFVPGRCSHWGAPKAKVKSDTPKGEALTPNEPLARPPKYQILKREAVP